MGIDPDNLPIGEPEGIDFDKLKSDLAAINVTAGGCTCPAWGNPSWPHQHGCPVAMTDKPEPDMVNHPPHYKRGPKIKIFEQGRWTPSLRIIECIEVIRWIQDPRLYTAMKYIWRVAFGGKSNDREDINKAVWYLRDWLENPVE